MRAFTPILASVAFFGIFGSKATADSVSLEYYDSNDCSGESELWYEGQFDSECEESGGLSFRTIYDPFANTLTAKFYSDKTCENESAEIQFELSGNKVCKDIPFPFLGSLSLSIKSSLSCFPFDSSVSLVDGSQKMVKDVLIGDKVAMFDSNIDAGDEETEVYAFLHRDTGSFLFNLISYRVDGVDKSLTISKSHLVLVESEKGSFYIPSDDVVIGNRLTVFHNGKYVQAEVLDKTNVVREGIVAPATLSGNLIVDGVVVSNYAVTSHTAAHLAFAPLRTAYAFAPETVKSYQTEKGVHPYAQTLFNQYEKLYPANDF